jgi:tetratricopeptide (TPR) repeat protein
MEEVCLVLALFYAFSYESQDLTTMNRRNTVMYHRTAITAVFAIAVVFANANHAVGQHNQHDPRALATNPLRSDVQIAPVLEGLGDHHHPVTSGSERAQLFFDQGLKLTYGFNHQEALRAFKEAVRLDPECAMAYWGWALVLGPNLNLPMQPGVVSQAYEAVQKAVALKMKVSEKERDYIEALAKRYTDDPGADRAPLDAAYAEAMRKLHEKYPEDDDAATLYAAALMNLSPWDYWTKDGRPNPNTPEVLAALETVMERDPTHEGALHYYIHALEAVDPERAEEAADRLRGLAPGAGHLVHMPSHIYMQVGRYAEAFEANTNAIKADEGYITSCRKQGIYPLNYYPHNIHFLAWAAIMEGRSEEAFKASRKVAGNVPSDMHGNVWALYQTFLSMPLYTMVRFGMWEDILEEKKPSDHAVYWAGIWHYARGVAYVHTGQPKAAKKELTAIETIVDDPQTSETLIGYSNATTLLRIAKSVLAGELEALNGNYDAATVQLDRAVRLEDSLTYAEPPDWYYPVRHTLGAVLLEAGRAEEAEVVYWQDLKKNRENGFALYGLAACLRAQGKDDEASAIEERFRWAWKNADINLRSSRF